MEFKETSQQALDTARHDAYVRGLHDAMALFEKLSVTGRDPIRRCDVMAEKQLKADLLRAQQPTKKLVKKTKKRTVKQDNHAMNDEVTTACA